MLGSDAAVLECSLGMKDDWYCDILFVVIYSCLDLWMFLGEVQSDVHGVIRVRLVR